MKDYRNAATRIILFALASCGTIPGWTQNLAQHNWFFGNSKNAIRFNRATNVAMLVTDQAVPFGTGGSAVATDPATADLFFYTDGSNVFDATHTIMPNGTGLAGNTSANEPVAVCAIPGQSGKYFIFTNSANFTTPGSITVSVVDMTQFGNSVFPSPPLGVVTTKNTAITGLTNVSEGMVIVPHANNIDFWLITQVNGTSNYNSTLINAASFTGTFANTLSSGVGNSMVAANISYSLKLKRIAIAPQTANVDIMLSDFNNTAGTFSNVTFVPNSGATTTGNQSVYDVQWDQKGRYLYFSRTGEPGLPADLLQYDALNPTVTLTSILPAPVSRSYGLQIGPDSAMYYLYQDGGGRFLIDKFTNTDTIASAVVRGATPFGTATDFAGTQFPEFLPKDSVFQHVDFTFNSKPNCQNTVTSFYPAVVPNADSLQWKFGDGGDTTTWSPNHTYQTSGTFNVTLTAFYQGQKKDTTKQITITPFTLKLTLVSDTTACKCQLPARKESCSLPNFTVTVKTSGGSGTLTYLWSNGDATATLSPDSAGYYYVVVKDASSGCSAYAGVNVKEFGLQDMRENKWYFGDNAGIDFNVSPPKALSESAMDAPAGCAVACDRDGQIVIYTDGDKVWDKKDVVIASGIGGDPASSQSAIIIPVTGDETLYYIFTTQAVGGTSKNEMRYSLYDLKKDSVVIQNVLLFSKSTEHLTGNSNWVIAHEYGNNTFRAYPVSIKGIGDPVYSAIGSDLSFGSVANGQGYMKLGDNNLLAVALSTPGVSNLVELYDFSDSTGMVTNYRKIDLKTTAGQVYGVEFAGGTKLFATVDGHPTPSFLYEYSIDSLGQPHLKNKQSVNAELGAVQIAPNGQVYVAVNGAPSLGTIAVNPDTTKTSTFTLAGFALAAGTSSTLGLPNFRQMTSNGAGGPGFTFTGTCLGDTTHFTGASRVDIDKFLWNFGDGGSSTDQNPSHFFADTLKHTVTMIIYNRCPNSGDTITQIVKMHGAPPKPTLKPSNALCNGPIVLDANSAGLPKTHYRWSTGDTTRTVTISQALLAISVTNTDQFGCSSTSKGSVSSASPKFDLGPDRTICENTVPLPVLQAHSPGATYQWTVPANVTPSPIDSANQTVSTDSLATLVPQFYKVVATVVVDPVSGKTCSAKDSITYTITPTPYFTFSGQNPSGGCGNPNGVLKLTLIGPPTTLFTYQISGDTALSANDQAAAAVITDNKARAGIYTVTVSDQVSQCARQKQVSLSDASVSVTIAPKPISSCDPVAIVATTTEAAPFNYTVYEKGGGIVDSNATPLLSNPITTKLLGPGFYTLVVKSGKCTATDSATITQPDPLLPISITEDLCDVPHTLTAATTAAGTPAYTWTGPAIAGGQGTNVLTVNPGTGTFIYTVTGSLTGFCPSTKVDTAHVFADYTASFSQRDNCSAIATLSATPHGNYQYLWFLQGGDGTPLGADSTFQVATTGTYYVRITDINACSKQSAPQLVNVFGELTSEITATQACADDSPFTLTATTNAPAGTASFTWLLNNVVIPGETSPTLVQVDKSTTPETYKVRVSTASCRDSSTLIVIPFPVPVGKLPIAKFICSDPANHIDSTRQILLDPGTFSSYDWSKDDLSLNYTDEQFLATSPGTYKVVLTNIFGCKGTDQTVLTLQCEPIIVAPTAFRPGSNLTPNQQFGIIYNFIDEDGFQVFIFNRWGELIYTSNLRDFKWNGTMSRNGEPTPGGTYAYVIKYKSSYRPEQGIQEKHGGVVLLR